MDRLLFGTAGIPIATQPRDTLNGIETVRKLGLGAMELEFVHSVNITADKAPQVKKAAAGNDVVLTCHGQYYMNLNAQENAKIEATIKRILHAARVAWLCGGYSITFHAAYYMGEEPKIVYPKIKERLSAVVKELRSEGNKIWIRPEITGKPTQFGTLEEVLKLSQEIEGVMPCIDFSHFHARTNGGFNTYEEFAGILADIEKALGKEGLKNMHCHVSGIEYGPKGEKNHLNLKESDLKFEELARAWRDYKIAGVVICESPSIEGDALLLKEAYSGKV